MSAGGGRPHVLNSKAVKAVKILDRKTEFDFIF
jgi:hypothetical protein